MDWSNENILEFIELLRAEPSIWNLNDKDHKIRMCVNDAWERVQSKFSVPCAIRELKKKRNILLTQYRDRLKRIKDSTQKGDSDEVYKPTWFAFDAMHNYMASVYDYRITGNNEETTEPERRQSERLFESCESDSRTSIDSNIERSVSRKSNSASGSDSYICKRQREMQDTLISNSQINEAFSRIQGQQKAANECDLYGQLIAEKLKPLEVEDRLVLMNEIDNLVFNYMMNLRKRCHSPRNVYLSSINEPLMPVNHTIHLPGPSRITPPDDKQLLHKIIDKTGGSG